MRAAMLALALACAAVAACAPAAARGLEAAVVVATGLGDDAVRPLLASASRVLLAVLMAAAGLVALTALVGLLRHALLRGRQVVRTVTWDCGYAEPTARMQYTGSSFAQPLVDLFGSLLRPRRHASLPAGNFPGHARLETHTPDIFRETLWAPAFGSIRRALWSLRWLQHGRVQLYVLYIALTLLVLLLWKVR
jgi:hypothetical protein